MTDDPIGDTLGAIAILVCTPISILTALGGLLDVATFLMATAAFLVALSNHE